MLTHTQLIPNREEVHSNSEPTPPAPTATYELANLTFGAQVFNELTSLGETASEQRYNNSIINLINGRILFDLTF